MRAALSLEIYSRSRNQKAPGQGQRQMTDIQLLDEQEVSRRLSVSVNTLRYWRACGDGPNYVKLGRLVRYDAVALEKFLLRNLRVSKARATMEEKRVAL
jgi:predicted DNA-binding transcriptional regulator AlpA